MTNTYTQYHKTYRDTHKDAINAHKRKRYSRKKYGVPFDVFNEFDKKRKAYISIYKMARTLDRNILTIMLDHACNS